MFREGNYATFHNIRLTEHGKVVEQKKNTTALCGQTTETGHKFNFNPVEENEKKT